MSISVCPLATISAPVERVWSLFSEPASYDLWWDAQTHWIFLSEPTNYAPGWGAQAQSTVPEGPASPGQKIYAQTTALGKQWTVMVIVEDVDEANRQIHLTTVLPWGITAHNHIACLPLDPVHCRVSFG